LTLNSDYRKLTLWPGYRVPADSISLDGLTVIAPAMTEGLGVRRREQSMQTSWEPKHSDALREHLAKGLPYSEIARRINAAFNTAYTRNATIGRAKRMGLAGLAETGRSRKPRKPRLLPFRKMRKHCATKLRLPRPVPKRAAALKLRCVGIEPRHLGLLELEARDCRYPYGGDKEGEAITFCGHPRRADSSYCTAHFHLTRGVDAAPDRSAIKVLLRLVEAA
jgi:GcrA cell cycle regulator